MAVDVKHRRQGYARLILKAAEALAVARGFPFIYLHARLGDEPAKQLYLSAGYEILQSDSYLVRLKGTTPRALMRKPL